MDQKNYETIIMKVKIFDQGKIKATALLLIEYFRTFILIEYEKDDELIFYLSSLLEGEGLLFIIISDFGFLVRFLKFFTFY